MRFEHPELIWLLLLALPALTAFFWWAWRKKRRLIAQFVQSRLLAHLTVGVSAARQKLRIALLVSGVGLVLFTLARPQWGYDWEEARQRGLDVVVAIDTSRSMLADDIKPNRLERAKLAAIDLKWVARADRMGLVAFAGSAFLQCPLTLDDDPFRQSVNALDVTIIPQGGTALAEAIQCAVGAFKEKAENHRVLVLFSDGEDHDGRAVETAQAAAKEGFRIFTIGVGTPNGELLRTTDPRGRMEYIKDAQGNVVKSRLNETLLRDIARAGNGFYMQLAGADTMEVLYERGLAPLPKADFSARRIQRWHERYQGFLGLALVLLLTEMFLPVRKRVRRTPEMAAAANEELRKAVAVLVAVLLLPGLASASASSARKKYDKGRYTSALLDYQRLLQEEPNDPRFHFNAGASAYRVHDYEEALKQFNAALVTPDLTLQQRAYYNLGNTQYRIGEEESDLAKKAQAWIEATNYFDTTLKLNPQDADAKHNLEFVTQKLAELPQPPPQPQQSQDNQDKKDDQQNQQQQQQNQQDQQQDQQQNQQGQQPEEKPDSQSQDAQSQQPESQQPQPNDPQNQAAQPGDQQDDPKEGEPRQAVMARMTPEQAAQLLEAVQGEEKLMPFQLELKTNRLERVFKDW